MKTVNNVNLKVFCPDCETTEVYSPDKYACSCGGAWEFIEEEPFDESMINALDASVWRYGKILNLGFETPSIRLGAGWTPLLPLDLYGFHHVCLKPEYYGPTGSFKDRGVAVMINELLRWGVDYVVEDSSGNAGASVAAYVARAGIKADIFTPSHASPAKLAQIRIYGANIRTIDGPRVNAKLAALEAVHKENKILASHAYHPAYLLGQQTAGWEVWEQLGKNSPDWVIVPVGQGGFMLAFWLAFKRLYAAGLIRKIPKMVAVQTKLLAPLCLAYEQGLDTVPAVEQSGRSIAEGLAIAKPVRGRRLLQAIRQSGGTCVMVSEEEIKSAQLDLARHGIYIEPTSATAIAALKYLSGFVQKDDVIVIPLTGSGLKGEPQLNKK